MTAKETGRMMKEHFTEHHSYYSLKASVFEMLRRHEALHESTECDHDHKRMHATNLEGLATQFCREGRRGRNTEPKKQSPL